MVKKLSKRYLIEAYINFLCTNKIGLFNNVGSIIVSVSVGESQSEGKSCEIAQKPFGCPSFQGRDWFSPPKMSLQA